MKTALTKNDAEYLTIINDLMDRKLFASTGCPTWETIFGCEQGGINTAQVTSIELVDIGPENECWKLSYSEFLEPQFCYVICKGGDINRTNY